MLTGPAHLTGPAYYGVNAAYLKQRFHEPAAPRAATPPCEYCGTNHRSPSGRSCATCGAPAR